jgi:prophage regulatory protein
MPEDDSKKTSPITLIRKAALAQQLGCSTWTIDRWVQAGQFPRPIYATDNSPAQWRMRDIEAWLVKRSLKRRKRYGFRGTQKQEMTDR